MGGGQIETPARDQAQPGQDNRYASAAGTPNLTRPTQKRHCVGVAYRIAPSAGEPFRIVVSGRVQWALDRLRAVGFDGCTPITEPAPRWAAYVHRLREAGVEIETITERHAGGFPGHHARYVLRSGAMRWAEGGAS